MTPRKRPRSSNSVANSGKLTSQSTIVDSSLSVKDELQFACPFMKKDATRWPCHSYRFRRIRDVKQHIHRRHTQPLYCVRCGQTFKKDDSAGLDRHIEMAQCWEVNPLVIPDGISQDISEQVSQKPPNGMEETAQWRLLWEILFSKHEPQPTSVYFDKDEYLDLAGFQDFAQAQAPRIDQELFDEQRSIPVCYRSSVLNMMSTSRERLSREYMSQNGTPPPPPLSVAGSSPATTLCGTPSSSRSSSLRPVSARGGPCRLQDLPYGESMVAALPLHEEVRFSQAVQALGWDLQSSMPFALDDSNTFLQAPTSGMLHCNIKRGLPDWLEFS